MIPIGMTTFADEIPLSPIVNKSIHSIAESRDCPHYCDLRIICVVTVLTEDEK